MTDDRKDFEHPVTVSIRVRGGEEKTEKTEKGGELGGKWGKRKSKKKKKKKKRKEKEKTRMYLASLWWIEFEGECGFLELIALCELGADVDHDGRRNWVGGI